MIKNLSALIFCIIASTAIVAAQYAKWTKTELTLNNGVVHRSISLPAENGHFLTTSYAPAEGESLYFQNENVDFQFEAGGQEYSGRSSWNLAGIGPINDQLGGKGVAVALKSSDNQIEITVNYLLYPELPVIRKNLVIKNTGQTEIPIESVDIERFSVTGYRPSTFSWIYSDYGRRKSIGPYKGNMHDPLVIVHNMDWMAGIVIGNEASGVLKNTTAFWGTGEIATGLTHKGDRFPFRKWLRPGESFQTPQVFTMVYNNLKDPGSILNTAVPDFVRKHMGIRLSELKEKPTFVYNTWHPFAKEINEKLVKDLAKAAADAGMKEFIIDDGWQDNYGDWGIDYAKFPNGLKPVFDYIKSLGMKPGLWISVGSASANSKIIKEHPEWFIKDKNGELANIHTSGTWSEVRSACFSTGWKDYIKNILMKLALDYGLEYMKLDFAVVTSAYVFDPEHSGCYAKDHPGHKDHSESMYVNYNRMWELFDELHAAKPDLFIDCTFETMGGLQAIDYAMLKHAEGNWLSNFTGPDKDGDLRIRNMAWWRSPAIAATALVIGNPRMDDKGWEGHIKSLAGALPIMLGDPRQLTGNDQKKYRQFADWLQKMQSTYDIMSFRQDLPGFGEPAEGFWDGFQRINTDTKQGGIIAVFRHGAHESRRIVCVDYLNPNQSYQIKKIGGEVVAEMTGEELRTKGFEVSFEEKYAGELFEVSSR